MDTSFRKSYKNCVIEVVVEDDLVTTTKVIRDGEVIAFICLSSDKNENGVSVCKESIDNAFAIGKESVDVAFDELLSELGLEPISAHTTA